MLRELRCWDNNLGAGYVVVGKEDNLEQVADFRIAVDDTSNGVDQLNDDLRRVIAGRSLASNHDDSGLEVARSLCLRRVLDHEVAMDHVEDVEKLALVLMYTLDLDVVE